MERLRVMGQLIWLNRVIQSFSHALDKRGAPRHDGVMVDKAHGR